MSGYGDAPVRVQLTRSTCLAMGAVAILALPGCGGGSGGDSGGGGVIPPFDLQGGVVARDLDGDGWVDVAVTNTCVAGPPPHPGSVRVYLHAGAEPRGFRAPTRYDVGADPWALTAADVTADGLLDLIVSTPDSDQLWLLEQDPQVAGTFRPAVRLEAGQKPAHVVAADLDGDGHLDLVIANDGINATGSGMTVLLADAARPGHFLPGAFHAMDDIARSSCVADFNGDGRPDIAVAAAVPRLVNDLQSVVQIYLQDALQPGHFVRAGRYAAGEQVLYLAAADLDSDGAVDIIADDGPKVLYNDPARPGTFADARSL
jgi:hypothetical protein